MKLRIVLKKSRICTVGTWPHTRPAISETLQYFEGGAWHDVMVVSEEEANKDRSPEQAADELSALSQEMGLYDDPEGIQKISKATVEDFFDRSDKAIDEVLKIREQETDDKGPKNNGDET